MGLLVLGVGSIPTSAITTGCIAVVLSTYRKESLLFIHLANLEKIQKLIIVSFETI
jgi:hypothetical protein